MVALKSKQHWKEQPIQYHLSTEEELVSTYSAEAFKTALEVYVNKSRRAPHTLPHTGTNVSYDRCNIK